MLSLTAYKLCQFLTLFVNADIYITAKNTQKQLTFRQKTRKNDKKRLPDKTKSDSQRERNYHSFKPQTLPFEAAFQTKDGYFARTNPFFRRMFAY